MNYFTRQDCNFVTGINQQIFDVAIVGAGPGGLSAAVRAAHRGMSYVLLEASDRLANTIQQYQKGKHVMAEPCPLPLRSDLAFAAGDRESILENWQQAIFKTNINIRYLARVTTIEGHQGKFRIALKSGESFNAKNIVLALGTQGDARKLNVPGEDLPFVQNTLLFAEDCHQETIVIVGAGDSAIENAIILSRHNNVILINRQTNFARAKDANNNQILKAIETGRVQCFYSTTIAQIESNTEDAMFPGQIVLNTQEGARTIKCHRLITRLGATPVRRFIEAIGVRFAAEQSDALPQLSLQYESNVPGVFIIGALAGYPLIKQALNQGYEVIEFLLGNSIKPTDHTILLKKLKSLPFYEDVDGALALIKKRVRLFGDINPLHLRELVMASKIITPKPGKIIYTQGSYASTFYNILQGSVYVNTGKGDANTLEQGQFFGEFSLLSGRPQQTTVIAGVDCILMETPRSAMHKLMRIEASVRKAIDKVSILRSLNHFLMPHLPMDAIHYLSNKAKIQRYAAGEILFQEGEPVDGLYLVRSGSVTLSTRTEAGDVVVAYCAVSSFIGLLELSHESSRMVTAQATVATEVISIDYSPFKELLLKTPNLRSYVQQQTQKQLEKYPRMQAEPERGAIMTFLMAHGIGEAINVLIIDEELCVGCDNCEQACAATHQGISRLDRKAGPSLYSLHIPTSCRHCESSHCMRDCPPDAIQRLSSGEVYINNDICIGCGNCVENCPYEVIKMAEVSPQQHFWDKLFGKKSPDAVSKTAVKCDMCKDFKGGMACVNACPTGAAIRIHAEQMMDLASKRADSCC